MNVSALWLQHRPVATSVAREWHIPGADDDDVLQEALVALWEAAGAWDNSLGVPFPAFARLVIKRRLADAVRNARAGKHSLLTDASRDVETHTTHDDIIQARQELRDLVARSEQLSLLERRAVCAVANGEPYSTVGEFRSVDNAVQRARRKLRGTA